MLNSLFENVEIDCVKCRFWIFFLEMLMFVLENVELIILNIGLTF
jgi:hypothetical protein